MPNSLEVPSIALIGECMIELREMPDGFFTRSYGGDVLNTAVYLSRLVKERAKVRFSTILGDDPFSTEMIANWAEEGLICDTIGRKRASNISFYLIQTDDEGERSFYYWRNHAPARELMDAQWAPTLVNAFNSSWIYVSGITLAILGDNGRERLVAHLRNARDQGAAIDFDGNFRHQLWPNKRKARSWYSRLWRLCTLALASAEDEASLYDDQSPTMTLERLSTYGIPEIVVKCGTNPLLLVDCKKTRSIAVEPANNVVDTTAAGDSFNAGYIAARISGLKPIKAAHLGSRLAAHVVQHSGAIIPLSAMPNIPLQNEHLHPS